MTQRTILAAAVTILVLGLRLSIAAPPLAAIQPADIEKAFSQAFYGITFPGCAMVLDKDENLLRARVRTLDADIAFLTRPGGLAHSLSKEQLEQLLPYARQAREICEARDRELFACWKAQIEEMNNYKLNLVGGKNKLRGTQNDVYPRGDADGFHKKIRQIDQDVIAKILTDDQRKLLAALPVGGPRVSSPGYVQNYWWGVDHGPLGPIGFQLVAPSAVLVIEKQLGLPTEDSETQAEASLAFAADLLQQHRDIVNLHRRKVPAANFVGGLNLTEAQLQSLLAITEDVARVQAEHAQRNRALLKPLVAVLTQIRDLALAGQAIPVELKARAIAAAKPISRGYRPRSDTGQPMEMLDCGSERFPAECGYPLLSQQDHQFTDDMTKLANRIRDEILMPQQAILIYTATSCYYPPNYTNHPVRVGEVDEEIVYAEQTEMARLRTLSADAYKTARDPFVAKIVSRLNANAGNRFAADKLAAETTRVGQIVDQTRALSDADFELGKYDMMDELFCRPMPRGGDRDYPIALLKTGFPPYYEKPIYKPYHGWSVSQQEMPLLFLGDPDHKPILDQLLANMHNFKPVPAADLTKLKVTAGN